MYVECPMPHGDRVNTMVVDCDDYGKMKESEEKIFSNMREDYERRKLTLLAPWGEECIPPTCAMPKRKAPKEKTRIVNSYARGPARKALKRAGRSLTWIFRQLPEGFTGFTLHSVGDAKERIMRGNAKILRESKEGWKMLVDQMDVIRMFTNLGKKEILRRVRVALQKAERMDRGRGARRNCLTLIMDGDRVQEVRWGTDNTRAENIIVTFALIMEAVEFDLAHNYCGVGVNVYEQLEGCPIGGLMSAIYANIYCAHDERAFAERWRGAEHLYYAMRQMDDGLLVIRWDEGDEEQQRLATALRDDARTNLYTGGPSCEVEEKIDWMGRKVRVWAGLQLRVGEQGLICKTHNKNEESISTLGVQKYPRYTQGYSYQGDQMRVGLMQGSAQRIRLQCMTNEDFIYDITLDLWECMCIGTSWALVSKALKRMPNMFQGSEEQWCTEKEQIRRELRRRVEKQRHEEPREPS
jgi:hypothetical protein